MSSRKRPRDSLGPDDEEVEIESANSSFRQTSTHKRSRVALAAEQGGSVVSDDDDASDIDMIETERELEELRSSVPPSINPSDVVTDIPSDEDEDGDEYSEELRAGRILAKERKVRQKTQNVVLDAGIIEEVYMQNFMCHANLRVKLGPLINFIIGHNGSGKSAILTALVMCLGGKAASTNRASSMKGTIKSGEQSATLAVTIKNQGEDAYKPDLYGISIIVERSFNVAGTSNFKLKNAGGKTISTKRADLDDMLDHFAFQLDNPMSVLSQDNARQFLAGSSAETKYKFFIKGTQLESLDQDYTLIEENVDSQTEKLREHTESLDISKAKLQEAERKKLHIESLRGFLSRINELKWMHAWAQVEQEEGVLADKQTALSEARTQVEALQAAEALQQDTVEGHEQAAETAERQLNSARNALGPIEEERGQAKGAFDENKQTLMSKKTEERQLREDLKNAMEKIEDAKKRVRAEEARIAANGDEAQQARERELEVRKTTAAEASRAYQEHKTGYGQVKERSEQAKQEQEAAIAELKAKADAEQEAGNNLRNCERSEGSIYDGYHNNMSQLVRAVKQETRFRGEVIGPLGHFVRLVDIKWQHQIESILSNNSSAFAVTNMDDKKLLTDMMHRCHSNHPILIGDNTPIDPTPNEPAADILTVYRALKFESEFAKRALILNNSIEQVALAKTAEEGKALVRDVGKAGNVKNAVVPTADGRGGVRYELSMSGQLKSTPIPLFKWRPRMKADREEQLASYRRQLEQAKQDRATAENRRRDLRRTVELAEQGMKKWAKEEKDKKVAMQQADAAVEDAKLDIENNRQGTGRLDELQSQVQQAENQKSVQEQTFEDVVNSMDELNTKQRALMTTLTAAQQKFDAAQKRITDAETRFDKCDADRREAVRDKSMATNRVQAEKDNVLRLVAKVDEQEKTVQEYQAAATTICERVTIEAGLKWQELDTQIADMEKEYEKMQREAGGTREELVLAWSQAKEAHRKLMAEFKYQEKLRKVSSFRHPHAEIFILTFAQTMTHTLTIRRRRWKLFRKFISMRARLMFQHLLTERKFRGRLLLKHGSKELEIKVEPSSTTDSDAGRQANTLSGGEKSYSLICLLLAIWEAMGTPIRCLDEFDVFMDSVNRSISMDMMIQAARGAQARQFILISPQAMSGVEMGDDVKIHKLIDPRLGMRSDN